MRGKWGRVSLLRAILSLAVLGFCVRCPEFEKSAVVFDAEAGWQRFWVLPDLGSFTGSNRAVQIALTT